MSLKDLKERIKSQQRKKGVLEINPKIEKVIDKDLSDLQVTDVKLHAQKKIKDFLSPLKGQEIDKITYD